MMLREWNHALEIPISSSFVYVKHLAASIPHLLLLATKNRSTSLILQTLGSQDTHKSHHKSVEQQKELRGQI